MNNRKVRNMNSEPEETKGPGTNQQKIGIRKTKIEVTRSEK